MSGPTTLPPAGWYPDPYDPRYQRYWDGAWTEHVAPATTGPASPAVRSGVVGPPTGRWGWGDVGWTTLATVVLVLASAFGLIVWILGSGATELDTGSATYAWLIVASQLTMWLGMAGWPLLAARRKGDGWRRSYGFVLSWRAAGIGLGGGVVLFFGMTALDLLVSSLINGEISSAAADTVTEISQQRLAFALMLVMIALGAPFVEELAFRGLLWGAVAKRGASPWFATLVAAVPFAVIHFEPMRIVSLVFAGLLLGVIRHFGGLGSSMLAHATVNSTAALLLAFTT